MVAGLLGWLGGWLVDVLVDWLIGLLMLWLDGWLIGWLTLWLTGWLVGWLVDALVGWLVGPIKKLVGLIGFLLLLLSNVALVTSKLEVGVLHSSW